ncbi:type VII secretion AAA-ATPase EccA [Gordonia pseudamarae]|jgi:type VII secretion ATPase EccA|uniref:Type VII secretion AAA-ATPase EccA n=1 Tax=Gordonia pseudamarae TaxID=2831662 RepID=A0ABX6IEE8_9ACTN|nr:MULTISPECIES: type VII secretion AAA-ATPase EccA [Gordonia]MBD0021778.1 type VII secretion AAA-ATPase EccA [Gordonia sp. (in: high G+C Gram-positive bacteria)]QHN25257.1 type VII secretion AAA-ATPase EccA [Gordonia pseudamarae]QHN34189.1 type VII secretion AAA-ATPase EccA [Gordonia pseudamarae]
MTQAAHRARQLFDLGILSLGIPVDGQEPAQDRAQAARAFTRASQWDPTMADAWLGRMACGENTDEVIAALYRHRDALGREQRRLRLPQRILTGRWDTTVGIDYPLADAVEAGAAYAATLIRGADPAGAADVLARIADDSPVVDLIRGVLQFATGRWNHVLTALTPVTGGPDPVLGCAARFMTGTACVQLGMFDEGMRQLADVIGGPVPALATQALFATGMALREQGNEAEALSHLQQAYARDPGFGPAADAMTSAAYRLVITTAAAIDARADPWTPDPPADATGTPEAGTDDGLVEHAQRQLDAQIGLDEVKLQVAKLRSAATMARLRSDKGLSTAARSLHLAFTGPPGTGKTTVARIVAAMYRGLGFIKSDKVVEVSRGDLVGQHLGSTAIKTSEVIDSALDGVLFIDEAYTLIQEGLSGGDAFGKEAVDTLLARMENDRDRLVVIIAGYDDEIDRFLAANDGLASRFSRRIRFSSYSPTELTDIGSHIAAGRDSTLTPDALVELERSCAALCSAFRPTSSGMRRGIDIAGNGRFIRNVIESAEEEREFRLSGRDDLGTLTHDDLMRIDAADIRAALTQLTGRA